MADWHFDDLGNALAKRGWRWVELPGDDYRTAATWELTRSRDDRVFYLDFDGFDPYIVGALPLEKSSGFELRGTRFSANFSRRGLRQRWLDSLEILLKMLEDPSYLDSEDFARSRR